MQAGYEYFKLFLSKELKREITIQEQHNLLMAIQKFVNSQPGSKERTELANYLFDLEFIDNKNMPFSMN